MRQKNDVVQLAMHEWVLSLDADEAVSSELRSELERVRESEPSVLVVGFYMSRCVFYDGRWIRHGDWYPDRLVRLFRREGARFAGGRVHERLELEGELRELLGDIEHYSFTDSADHWARCQKYAWLWAEDARDSGNAPNDPPNP
jgi:hypothetical protein